MKEVLKQDGNEEHKFFCLWVDSNDFSVDETIRWIEVDMSATDINSHIFKARDSPWRDNQAEYRAHGSSNQYGRGSNK